MELSEDVYALNDKGMKAMKAGSFVDAAHSFHLALDLYGDNQALLFNLAQALYFAGRTEEALAYAQRGAHMGDNALLANLEGLCLYECGDSKGALKAYKRAIESDPDMAEAWNNSGVVHFTSGRFNEAREAFEKAVSLDKSYEEAWFNLRDTFDELGMAEERDKADEAYQSLRSTNN